eukprot:TRINITY_DN18108_c0_g1_i2.p1 TRINITY_DN18108_c0_g1~~TRINITY_DN18108_c0_g1_i2.p1  ORF type:complete len:365 (-),score=41.88 TRINITY_DN18108_c0_g1_i2:312-1361(-)
MASGRSELRSQLQCSSCSAILKLLSERLQTPSIARWRRSSFEISDRAAADRRDYLDGQGQLPSLLQCTRQLEQDTLPKTSQLHCCLRDVKTQAQEHLRTVTQMQKDLQTQAQTRPAFGVRKVDSSDQSSAAASVHIRSGELGSFSGMKSPALSKHIHQPVSDVARCRALRDPGLAVPSNYCDQSQLVRGRVPNVQSSTLRSPEHAQAGALEGENVACSIGQVPVLRVHGSARSSIETPREPRPMLQEERSSCRPRARQFPLLVRQDELALVAQQAHVAHASNEDWQASSLRLTSQEFEVWFQPALWAGLVSARPFGCLYCRCSNWSCNGGVRWPGEGARRQAWVSVPRS